MEVFVISCAIQEDMIDGEMFKQLGVKEEDKDADEEAADMIHFLPVESLLSLRYCFTSAGFDSCGSASCFPVDYGPVGISGSLGHLCHTCPQVLSIMPKNCCMSLTFSVQKCDACECL